MLSGQSACEVILRLYSHERARGGVVLLTFTYDFLSIESYSQSPRQHLCRRNHFTLIVSPPYSRKTRRHQSSEADTICKSPAHHYRVISKHIYVVQKSTSKPPTEKLLVVPKVLIDKITVPSWFRHDTLTTATKTTLQHTGKLLTNLSSAWSPRHHCDSAPFHLQNGPCQIDSFWPHLGQPESRWCRHHSYWKLTSFSPRPQHTLTTLLWKIHLNTTSQSLRQEGISSAKIFWKIDHFITSDLRMKSTFSSTKSLHSYCFISIFSQNPHTPLIRGWYNLQVTCTSLSSHSEHICCPKQHVQPASWNFALLTSFGTAKITLV
jgi:hypothetical protein